MQKKRSLLSSIFFLSIAVFYSVLGTTAQNPPYTEKKTAAQEFKNIRILKDVPADQLIPSMQFISASLGVECEYCRVERAFDKDDKKPKKTARSMMEMM